MRIHAVVVTVVVLVMVTLAVTVIVVIVVTVVVVVDAPRGLGRGRERAFRRAKETRAANSVAIASCRVTLKSLSPPARHLHNYQDDQNHGSEGEQDLGQEGGHGCNVV